MYYIYCIYFTVYTSTISGSVGYIVNTLLVLLKTFLKLEE